MRKPRIQCDCRNQNVRYPDEEVTLLSREKAGAEYLSRHGKPAEGLRLLESGLDRVEAMGEDWSPGMASLWRAAIENLRFRWFGENTETEPLTDDDDDHFEEEE